MKLSSRMILSAALALTFWAPVAAAQQAGDDQSSSMQQMQPMRPSDNPPSPTPAPQQRTVIDLDAPAANAQPSAATESVDDEGEPSGVRAEDVLREFQLERPKPIPVLPGKSQERDVTGDEPAGALTVPDGYFIVDRSVRLVHEGEWWVIHFVADNNPDTSPQKPMKLLPNRMLERMIHETRVVSQYEYIVSGEVTQYMNENYLLLRKLMRRRDMGNLRL